jgi:hypothetical protein
MAMLRANLIRQRVEQAQKPPGEAASGHPDIPSRSDDS